MNILCKRCNFPVDVADVNIVTSLAKCSQCNSVFDIRKQADRRGDEKREISETPKGIEINTTMQGLEIVRRWWSIRGVFMGMFCLFWDTFMVVWFYKAITEKQWEMAAFGSIHAAVGIGITYFFISTLLNSTYISITPGSLGIKHKPMPWLGNKIIPVGDIDQVFVKEKITNGKNGRHYHYSLRYLTKSGKDKKLFAGMKSPQEALFLEQEIEKTLGIEDRQVEGDYVG